MNLLNFCIDFINSVPRISPQHLHLSKNHQILEFQTLELKLPRQTGKTSTIKSLYHILPNATVVCVNTPMARYYDASITEATFLDQINFPYPRGIIPTINYLLLDELPVKQTYLNHPSITRETIIISLSTPK